MRDYSMNIVNSEIVGPVAISLGMKLTANRMVLK